eukprot:2906275-Pyramimonas_sp.AAC.2
MRGRRRLVPVGLHERGRVDEVSVVGREQLAGVAEKALHQHVHLAREGGGHEQHVAHVQQAGSALAALRTLLLLLLVSSGGVGGEHRHYPLHLGNERNNNNNKR